MDIDQDCRTKCREKFQDLLDYNGIDNSEDLATDIESGIYDFSNEIYSAKNINLLRLYMNKCISIYTNLNPSSYIKNTEFLQRVSNRKFDPKRLAFMSPQDIFPENWQKLIDRKHAKDEFLYSKVFVARTNEFKCGKCKKNECTYYQLQIRSADEPMTTFVSCLECGNKWHF